MLVSDVLEHFKSRAEIARALGLSKKAVYQWGEHVPPLRAAQLQRITHGKLKFDPGQYGGYWQQGHDERAS